MIERQIEWDYRKQYDHSKYSKGNTQATHAGQATAAACTSTVSICTYARDELWTTETPTATHEHMLQ